MKTVIFFLAVVSCTYALTCKKGAAVTAATSLVDDTCTSGVDTCMKPKAIDDNDFKDYGCGTCTDTAKCETCNSNGCNTFVAPTFSLKCYTSKTKSENCPGLSAAGCYTVKADYKGTNAALKDKYGGCGKCDAITPALTADDLKFCTSCDKADCNKPSGSQQVTFTLASIIAVLAFYL